MLTDEDILARHGFDKARAADAMSTAPKDRTPAERALLKDLDSFFAGTLPPPPESVLALFEFLFPSAVALLDPALKDAMASMPVDSACGADCAECLRAAAAFRSHLVTAWGAEGYPERITPSGIARTAAEACGTFITG